MACKAWARPISPPSIVTALLSAMFCGFIGATRTPSRCNKRQSAATTVLLPASDVVPCTIKVEICMRLRFLKRFRQTPRQIKKGKNCPVHFHGIKPRLPGQLTNVLQTKVARPATPQSVHAIAEVRAGLPKAPARVCLPI